MSADIGPGDLVLCVDAQPFTAHPACATACSRLREGRVYRVTSKGRLPSGDPGVAIAEVSNADIWPAWHDLWQEWRFRKLNDGEDDAELIARIKSCRPVREPELAGRSGFAVGLSSFGSRPQAVAPLRASIPNAGGAR